MRSTHTIIVCCLALILSRLACLSVMAQERQEGKIREGTYEITLKTSEPRKISVDELVRDRELNPRALYRVKTGGYLAFEEEPWVESIEFKVFDKPAWTLPQYQKFSMLLVEINKKLLNMRSMLDGYDGLALRLSNICKRSRFSSLQEMDDAIFAQLEIYDQLVLLRSLVVNAMDRFVKERSCKDKYGEYNRSLKIYAEQLSKLSENYERLVRRGLSITKDIKGATETDTTEKEKQE